jgi:hypothetical protein
MKNCLLICVAVLGLAVGVPASAQYMWIDVNGDGVCTTDDNLSAGTTSVDIWLSTNLNLDTSDAFCPTGEALTMNSYTFILRSGGGVTYGAWTDMQGFGTNLYPGTTIAGNDRWIGRGSGTPLAPGTYKLGSHAITVTGDAQLEIVASTSATNQAITSFGSQCPGVLGVNTLKLGVDWFDVCGTAPPTAVTETTWGKIKALYRGN